MKKIKIVNVKRFVIACIVMVAIIIGLCYTVASAFMPEERVVVEEKTHYVSSNDTLWDICKPYCPDNMDIREFIYLTEEYNGGISANLQVGQEIVIPIYE